MKWRERVIRRLRLALAAVVAGACAMSVTGPVVAQADFPSKPMRFLVGAAAGGVSDIVSRVVAQEMSNVLKQQVIVENRPGAASVLAIEIVASSPPDGYTMGFAGAAPLGTGQLLGAKPRYAPSDLTLVGSLGALELIVVTAPGSPLRTPQDVIAAAKRAPGAVAYGNGGFRTPAHLGFEYWKMLAGVDMPGIAYKGDAPALTDTLSGQVPVTVTAVASVAAFLKAGKLRPIGIFSPQRSPLFPNVPTIAESGWPEFDATAFGILVVPSATPASVVNRLNAALNDTFRNPAVRERLTPLGVIGGGGTLQEARDFIARENAKWARVIREQGIKGED